MQEQFQSSPAPAPVSNARRFNIFKLAKAQRRLMRDGVQAVARAQRADRPEDAQTYDTMASRKAEGIAAIEELQAGYAAKPVRCALPKKKQRELGILPEVGSEKLEARS